MFAIKLLDITRHHRLLFGTDFFADFEVPLRLHRLQVERELRVDWLRLRQAILAAPLSYKAHLAVRRSPSPCSVRSPATRSSRWASQCPPPNAKR